MKTTILSIPLALCVLGGAKAQSIGPATLNAAGNSGTISGAQFDWSVGEMTMVSTLSNPNIVVTQGVLQTWETPTGVAEIKMPGALHVFPNPATDVVNLQYTSPVDGMLSCKLLDMTGRKISVTQIAVMNGQAAGEIDIRALAAATYMLEVIMTPANGTPTATSYKIQKLQ